MKRLVTEFRVLWREGGWMTRAAVVVLACAVIVHLLALGGLGLDAVPYPIVLVIHCAVMLIGVLLVGRGFSQELRARRAGVDRRALASPRAWPLWLLFVAIGLYMGGWFLYLVAAWGSGDAALRDGMYAWVDGARVVRTLTRQEYDRWNAASLAAFSTAWCWFALAIALGHRKADVQLRDIRARRATRPAAA